MDSNRLRICLLGTASLALLVASGHAQCELRTVLSPRTFAERGRFGSAFAKADFDRDGFEELLVGTPGYKGSGTDRVGGVYLFDPPTFALAGEYPNPQPVLDDEFGAALAAADFDGDSHYDFAVGAPGKDDSGKGFTDSGAVYVYWGPDFQTWTKIDGLADGGRFGQALAVGDISAAAPGARTLVVGAPEVTVSGLASSGQAYLFVESARMFGLVATLATPTAVGSEQFGLSFAIDDMDGDGKNDLAIGAPFATVNALASAGNVYWLQGPVSDRQTGKKIDPPTVEVKGRFGLWMATANLLNNDSKQDLVIGAAGVSDSGAKNAGVLYICDGADVSVATKRASYSPEGGGFYGTSVLAGDLDGDGIADVAGGEPLASENGQNRAGSITCWLGPSFTSFRSITPQVDAQETGNLGAAMIAIDTNDDGIVEVAAGLPGRDLGGLDKVGRALVVDFSVDLPYVGFSAGMPGSAASEPTLQGIGTGLPGAIDSLVLNGGIPQSIGLLLVGIDRAYIDLPGDGILLTNFQFVSPFVTDGAGNFLLSYGVPSSPICVPYFLQVFLEDPLYAFGYRHTAGLQLTIQN